MENKFSDILAKSLIYKINNKGPSMDPYGTPSIIGMVAYILFPIFQIAFKPVPMCSSNTIFVKFV